MIPGYSKAELLDASYLLLFFQNISPVSTRIIHYNQLMMTKFGRSLRLMNR